MDTKGFFKLAVVRVFLSLSIFFATACIGAAVFSALELPTEQVISTRAILYLVDTTNLPRVVNLGECSCMHVIGSACCSPCALTAACKMSLL